MKTLSFSEKFGNILPVRGESWRLKSGETVCTIEKLRRSLVAVERLHRFNNMVPHFSI